MTTQVASSGAIGRERKVPGQPLIAAKPEWIKTPFVMRTLVPVQEVTMGLNDRGSWDPDVEYHAGPVLNHEPPERDLVRTTGGTYVAWRSSRGVAPPNPEFWAAFLPVIPQYTGNGYTFQAYVNTYGIYGDWPTNEGGEAHRIGPDDIVAYSRGPRWRVDNYEYPGSGFAWSAAPPTGARPVTSSVLTLYGEVDIKDGPAPLIYPGSTLQGENSTRLHMRLDFTVEHSSPWEPTRPIGFPDV